MRIQLVALIKTCPFPRWFSMEEMELASGKREGAESRSRAIGPIFLLLLFIGVFPSFPGAFPRANVLSGLFSVFYECVSSACYKHG